MQSKRDLYGALVWLASATFLSIYLFIFVSETYSIPGAENLTAWLLGFSGITLVVAGFIASSVEGLYGIGSFFPGSSLMVFIGFFAALYSIPVFLITMMGIALGWIFSSLVNCYLASKGQLDADENISVKEHYFTTWYPAFRANYEVASVLKGASVWDTIISSTKVKIATTIAMTVVLFAASLFVNPEDISNEDGVAVATIIILISFVVGFRELHHYFKTKNSLS